MPKIKNIFINSNNVVTLKNWSGHIIFDSAFEWKDLEKAFPEIWDTIVSETKQRATLRKTMKWQFVNIPENLSGETIPYSLISQKLKWLKPHWVSLFPRV